VDLTRGPPQRTCFDAGYRPPSADVEDLLEEPVEPEPQPEELPERIPLTHPTAEVTDDDGDDELEVEPSELEGRLEAAPEAVPTTLVTVLPTTGSCDPTWLTVLSAWSSAPADCEGAGGAGVLGAFADGTEGALLAPSDTPAAAGTEDAAPEAGASAA